MKQDHPDKRVRIFVSDEARIGQGMHDDEKVVRRTLGIVARHAVAGDRVEAVLRDGVLTVTIPRHPPSRGRRIAVETG